MESEGTQGISLIVVPSAKTQTMKEVAHSLKTSILTTVMNDRQAS